MAKINHLLTENILVTSSFSTAFVVPSRVRCIAVTGVWMGMDALSGDATAKCLKRGLVCKEGICIPLEEAPFSEEN